MRLGAQVFMESDDPGELAREHKRRGYSAAFCPPLALNEPEKIRAVREAFAREDVLIAEVGAWCNMMDPDPAKRRAALEFVTDRLALADEVGAHCCVNVAGSFHPTSRRGPHPDDLGQPGFDLTVENVRKIVDAVKPKRARFALEMMGYAMPNSPELYLRLLQAVDRPAFAAHLDPVNSINCPERYFHSGAFIRRCFELLGPWIVSCHAKDTLMQPNLTIHIDEVRAGLGVLDYRAYLSELARLPEDTPLMIEHLGTNEEYALAADYIRSVAAEVGTRIK